VFKETENAVIEDVSTAEMAAAAAISWRLYKNGPEEAAVECPAKGGLLLHWHKPVRGLRGGNQHTPFSVLDLCVASTVGLMFHSSRQYVTLTSTSED
jgi:hypothetical protein